MTAVETETVRHSETPAAAGATTMAIAVAVLAMLGICDSAQKAAQPHVMNRTGAPRAAQWGQSHGRMDRSPICVQQKDAQAWNVRCRSHTGEPLRAVVEAVCDSYETMNKVILAGDH